jgi:methionine-rich copper-binding protein CopC
MIQAAGTRIFFAVLALIAAAPHISVAQEESAEAQGRIAGTPEAILQEFQDDVLRVFIAARVMGSDGTALWNMDIDELTVPGRGVNVRLNGQNIVVEVEFTPYRQADTTIMLIAQGQTWITSDAENKLHYQTSLKSIPINAGEPVIFYPLGIDSGDGSTLNLELEITVTNFIAEVRDTSRAGGQ